MITGYFGLLNKCGGSNRKAPVIDRLAAYLKACRTVDPTPQVSEITCMAQVSDFPFNEFK